MTGANILIIINLFFLESILSVDNAAVLAVMVKDLPEKQRPKALKYGLIGAFIFRGICLILAAWLVKILWLKIIGGLYLLYLVYSHFTPKKDSIEEGIDKQHNWLYRKSIGLFGAFWSTVILVEIMDLAFSIDNIFAAVALTNNIYLIMLGVFIGIIAMRFVAQWFVIQMEKHPTLEKSAFIVIALLGVKLVVSGSLDYMTGFESIKHFLSSHTFDIIFTTVTMLIFLTPFLIKKNAIRKETKDI